MNEIVKSHPGSFLANVVVPIAWVLFALSSSLASGQSFQQVIESFEKPTYAEIGWTVESGTAMGTGPAAGRITPQNLVTGYFGNRLINTYYNSVDGKTTGTDDTGGILRSPEYTIPTEANYISFVIGAGFWSNTCVQLFIEGQKVATVSATESWLKEGNERLRPAWFDVRPHKGKTCFLRIEDSNTSTSWLRWWGHINVDHFMWSGVPIPAEIQAKNRLAVGAFRPIFDNTPSGSAENWYVNDHCFIYDRSNSRWHLYGITNPVPYNADNERIFCHGSSPLLTNPAWTRHEPALQAVLDKQNSQYERAIWAPHIIEHKGTYYMYYHASTDSATGDRSTLGKMQLATSTNLTTWTRHPENPVFLERHDPRDPMVLKLSDNPTSFIMYYTLSPREGTNRDTVAYRTSSDLIHWSAPDVAYDVLRVTSGGGPTESPYVVKRSGIVGGQPVTWYYLFIGPRSAYSSTEVFRSDNPYRWTEGDLVGHVAAHAAEVIQDVDGRWYVSHCRTAYPPNSGSSANPEPVWLAPITWNDGLPEETPMPGVLPGITTKARNWLPYADDAQADHPDS